jgi:hypothetical protein
LALAGEPTQSHNHHVLLDSVHAHNFLDKGLEEGNRNYHSLFGLKDGVEFLRQSDFLVEEISHGTLTDRRLNRYDTLLINLVSDNLPAFLVSEIGAIKAFVEAGGNLLVLTDHSNAYHHTWKLQPLFEVLGVSLHNESILERAPYTIGPGPGWIRIETFSEHPVTEDLETISFHTGGTVDSQGGVAFSSSKSWGDLWGTDFYGENALQHGNRGNYGDFTQEPAERTGPLSVVMARHLGKGKVVVVGDQNIFGNLWIRFGDNFKLFMNIFQWFSDSTTLSNGEAFLAGTEQRVLLLDNLENSQFGNYGQDGLYHAYSELARHFDTYIHNRIDYRYDLIVLSPSIDTLTSHQKAEISKHLSEDKPLLILGSAGRGDTDFSFLTGRTFSPDPGFAFGAKTSQDGALTVLRDVALIANRVMPSPYQEPTDSQARTAEKLVKAIKMKMR